MPADSASYVLDTGSEDSWEVLRDATRDSFGLPNMIPDLFELLGNTQPTDTEESGGLDISVVFITWLERNNVIDFNTLIEFGEKEYIEYFKMVDDIEDIKTHLIDIKRIRSLSLFWREIQRKDQTKSMVSFTKRDFVWEIWNSLHQDSHKSMNGRFSRAKKAHRKLQQKHKEQSSPTTSHICTQC